MMRIPTDVKAVLNRALETWGLHEQRMMAIGEFGELLSLFGKDVQGRATNEDWIDEIADAFVMLYQLALIHGEEEVYQRFFDKIQRLHLILEGQGPDCGERLWPENEEQSAIYENTTLRAELERVRAERDAAMHMIDHLVGYLKLLPGSCEGEYAAAEEMLEEYATLNDTEEE